MSHMTDCTWDLGMTFSPALDVVDGAADVDPAAAPLVALLLGVPGGAGDVVAAVPAAGVVAEHVGVVAARVRVLQALVDVLKGRNSIPNLTHILIVIKYFQLALQDRSLEDSRYPCGHVHL